MNILLYARVSSNSETQKNVSVSAQLSAMKKFAKVNGMSVIDTYIETVKPTKPVDCPEFKKLIKFCRKKGNQVDAVIVYKFDLLRCCASNLISIKSFFRKMNIELIFMVEDCKYSPYESLTEKLRATIIEHFYTKLGEEVEKGHLSFSEKKHLMDILLGA